MSYQADANGELHLLRAARTGNQVNGLPFFDLEGGFNQVSNSQ
jgi:hypothetical protein